MPSVSYFTPSTISLFVALGVIRGSFSIVIHFADESFKSPSLVFLLRTPGTVLLYIILAFYLASKDDECKQNFKQNLRNVRNYWKSAIMGFVQLASPYVLFMYGLKVLSPTSGGVFMAAAPWFATLIERLPCIKHKASLTPLKILAMVIGFGGVIIVSIADVLLALQSDGDCHLTLKAPNQTMYNNTLNNHSHNHMPAYGISVRMCKPYTERRVICSLFALLGGSVMWSVSSVFWRSKRGDIHYVIGGIWNNVFGGLYALGFWFAIRHYENNLQKVDWVDVKGILSIIFLTILSGWVAALIVNYMYKNVGPAATNRVLCLVPLFTWIEDWIFVREFREMEATALIALEVIGLVLTFSGLITSSLEMENTNSSLHAPLLQPANDNYNGGGGPFDDSYRGLDDGATSEEEIDSTVRNQASSPFPPLVEVRPEG